MPENALINQETLASVSPIELSLVIKGLTLTAFAVYALFAFILVRQVRIKRNTVQTPLGPRLTIIAQSHLAASLLLIVVSFFVL